MQYFRKHEQVEHISTWKSFWLGVWDFIAELSIYFFFALFFGTSAGLVNFGGILAFFVFIPFIAIIYYYGFHKEKTVIKTESLRAFDMKLIPLTSSFLSTLIHNPTTDLEKLRIPLLSYTNLICERYSLELLEDIVVNLNRVIKE